MSKGVKNISKLSKSQLSAIEAIKSGIEDLKKGEQTPFYCFNRFVELMEEYEIENETDILNAIV